MTSVRPMEHAHDTEGLQDLMAQAQRRLQSLADRDMFAELAPIWRRPGWTTPAEFFLVREAVAAFDAQVTQLERTAEVILQGSELVAPPR